jgi:hypothetical protein
MKTMKWIGGLTAVVLLTSMLVYTGCKKEEYIPEYKSDIITEDGNNAADIGNENFTVEIKKFEEYINEMRQNSENKSPKSKKVRLGRGIWLMEALLNKWYGNIKPFHDAEEVRTIFYLPGKQQGNKYFMLFNDVIQVLDSMELQCVADAAGITTPCYSKHIIGIDLDLKTSIDPINGDKIFKVELTTMIGLMFIPPSQIPEDLCFPNAYPAYDMDSPYGCPNTLYPPGWWLMNSALNDPLNCAFGVDRQCDYFTDYSIQYFYNNGNCDPPTLTYFIQAPFSGFNDSWNYCLSQQEVHQGSIKIWDFAHNFISSPPNKQPAYYLNKAMPAAYLCNAKMYYWLEMRFARCATNN